MPEQTSTNRPPSKYTDLAPYASAINPTKKIDKPTDTEERT